MVYDGRYLDYNLSDVKFSLQVLQMLLLQKTLPTTEQPDNSDSTAARTDTERWLYLLNAATSNCWLNNQIHELCALTLFT